MQVANIRKPYIQTIELPYTMTRKKFKKLRKKGAGFKESPVPEFLIKIVWKESDAV